MSLKKWLLLTVPVVILGAGYLIFKPKNSTDKPHRVFLQSSYTSKGMVDRVIQIKLNYPEAKSNLEKIEITAEVQMPFNFDEKLHYRWRLGQDVIHKEGHLIGEINGLSGNESKKIYLTVSGFSKETSRQIKFEIYGFKDGKSIYGDSIISSDLDNTFENTVQNVERIKASE